MINIAILGTGAIAQVHIDAYKRFEQRCSIAALCDIYPEKAVAVAEDKELEGVRIYSDYKEILADDNIDLVSICLPPSVHASIAVDCLNAGKHVLVEKPMASSLEECDRMIEAERKSGKILSVVFQNRFQNQMNGLKQIIDEGYAGKVLHTAVNSYWWRGGNYYDLWWRGTWEKEGGGCTMNHAVHHIDLLKWLKGMPTTIQAFISNLNHDNSETEDFSTAVYTYADGTIAQLNASLVHHGEEQEIILQCEKGRLSVPWKAVSQKTTENGFPQDDSASQNMLNAKFEAFSSIPYSGHEGQIENVLSAIESRGSLLVTSADGREALELIVATYKSAIMHQPVELPVVGDDPFYRKETMIAEMPRFHEKTHSENNFSTSKISLGRNMDKGK